MSRTYKDRPYWVRSNDPKEYRKAFHACAYLNIECSLKENCVPTHARNNHSCYYMTPGMEYDYNFVTSKEAHTDWHNPERLRERDVLREFVKNFNSGTVDLKEDDLDFANFQHRHRTSWNH